MRAFCKVNAISQIRLLEEISDYCFTLDPQQTEEFIKSIEKDNFRLKRKIRNVQEKYVSDAISDETFIYLLLPLEKELEKNRKLLHFNSADYQKISEIADENLAEKKLYVQKHIEKIIIDPKRKKIKKIIFKS